MKSQESKKVKGELQYSGAIIARRYIELQRLRDEVREAEESSTILQGSTKHLEKKRVRC